MRVTFVMYMGWKTRSERLQKKSEKPLIETIALSHPESPASIPTDEYENCIRFLSHFRSIYTLNYDMLL